MMNETKEKIRCSCLEKEAAPCVSVCPFHFDAREFIPRVQRGAFNLAYRHYANSVGFPRIISEICDGRCRTVCPRKDIDSPVDITLLERASVAYATRTAPSSYNMPAKGQKIAVIGAGISGLSCALRLANKKYGVDVYEKSGRVGGLLWDCLSPEIFFKDIEEQFSKEEYSLFLNTNITDLDELKKRYDSVYIATGADGEDFGLGRNRASGLYAADGGVFIGGSVTGASLVDAAAHGLKAAQLIENFLKTGLTKGPEPYIPTKIKLDLSRTERKQGIIPSPGTGYSSDEAMEEASRCISCKCDYCVHSCDMMAYFQKFPKLIEEEVHITINPGTLDGNGTVATRLISTCNQCGLCGKVCPEGIDVGLFMRESHRAMRAKNAMPWAFHEFWLNDMNFALSDRASFFHVPDGCLKPRYLFFPGCQMGASDPRYVTESYRLIMNVCQDTAIFVSCCGAPAVWSGDEEVSSRIQDEIVQKWETLGKPEFIFGCPTCREMIGVKVPEIRGKMLSDLLCETNVRVGGGGMPVSVFDPCAARNFPDTQKNVRLLLECSGYKLVPLEYEKERTKCCSWGGQISIANPPYTRWLIEKRVKEGEYPYVVYCTNCRDIFADAGKPVLHILDLIMGENRWDRKPPTYSKRRLNRELVKAELTREWEGKEMEQEKRMKLFISAEIEEKLNKSKILEDDVRDVINFCEETGRKLLDPDTGHSLGYTEIGHMTCWAEYSPENNGWRVHNAYSHRMKIELEEVWHGRKQTIDMQPL